MKKITKNLIISCFLLGILIVTISAYSISVTPLGDDGKYQAKTSFFYTFNFTTDANCIGVVLSASNSTITDYTGRGFFNMDISTMKGIPTYLCEYRDGILRKTHSFSDIIFRDIFGRSLNVSNNITASWFNGYINASNILNAPFSWLNTTNSTYRTLTNQTFGGNLSVDTNALFVNTNGKLVGINTTTPKNALNVIGSINATASFINGANTGITGNWSVGECWMAYSGGILYATNCTQL